MGFRPQQGQPIMNNYAIGYVRFTLALFPSPTGVTYYE